jgi:UDP-2,3-diacylglucosamine pyrophosphatase LpxH
MLNETEGAKRYRTIWLSDIHLGTKGCQAELLLEFLKETESEYLFLVGDIVDGWRLTKSWYWPQAHNDVVQKVLRKARKGTKVTYIPGNHDEGFRQYCGMDFGENILISDDFVHTMANGKRFLITHGDKFDAVMNYAKWLAKIGDYAYSVAIMINVWFNTIRRRLNLPYWSLSAYLKYKVKNAVEFIGAFETVLAEEARRKHVDGVICGHIHHAQMREINGITYCNDGDWVESCTALVEHESGELEILDWSELRLEYYQLQPRSVERAAAA